MSLVRYGCVCLGKTADNGSKSICWQGRYSQTGHRQRLGGFKRKCEHIGEKALGRAFLPLVPHRARGEEMGGRWSEYGEGRGGDQRWGGEHMGSVWGRRWPHTGEVTGFHYIGIRSISSLRWCCRLNSLNDKHLRDLRFLYALVRWSNLLSNKHLQERIMSMLTHMVSRWSGGRFPDGLEGFMTQNFCPRKSFNDKHLGEM